MPRSKKYRKSKKTKKKTKNTKEIITVANKIVKETQKYRKKVQKNVQKLSAEDKKKIIPHIRNKDKTLKRTRSGASNKKNKLFKPSKQILNEIKKYNRKIDSILQKYPSSFTNKVLKKLQTKKIKSGSGWIRRAVRNQPQPKPRRQREGGEKKVTFSDTVVEKTEGGTNEFKIGETVEYESSTNNRWIDAKVLAVRPEDGSIDLDVRKSADLARVRKKTEDTKTNETDELAKKTVQLEAPKNKKIAIAAMGATVIGGAAYGLSGGEEGESEGEGCPFSEEDTNHNGIVDEREVTDDEGHIYYDEDDDGVLDNSEMEHEYEPDAWDPDEGCLIDDNHDGIADGLFD